MKHPKPTKSTTNKKGRWRKGPLPKNTYGWGGIVTKDCPDGFFLYADFCGDYAMTFTTEKGHLTTQRVEAADILLWDNALTEPPKHLLEEAKKEAGSGTDDVLLDVDADNGSSDLPLQTAEDE